MIKERKHLELPMHDRICTEITVNEHDEIELVQSIPVMWTTTDTTIVLTKEEFAKLFMFVFSEERPTSPGWWLSSEGDMLKVLNGSHCYLNHMSHPIDFSCLSFPDNITWTKIANLKS